MRATVEEILLWEQRINERILSRMTIKEWCIKNEISKHKYNYWVHRIRQNQGLSKEELFAEVTPILSTANLEISDSVKSDDFQIFFKNIQITVPSNFNSTSLTGLMKVLQEL